MTLEDEESERDLVGSEGGEVATGDDSECSDNFGDFDSVYDFKDNKTNGTVTVTKEWNDKKTNEERPEPEIKISTKKPSKSTLGYTITFHGNENSGLAFADGSYANDVVYNGSGEIVSGMYKIFDGINAAWYLDKNCTQKVDIDDMGTININLSEDLDIYGKVLTFDIKGYGYTGQNNNYSNQFSNLIPKTVTSIIFTDEVKPASASIIDVDADSDGGVIAWTENDNTVMKVSTQIKGVKVQGNSNSKDMFARQEQLQNIDFANFDTEHVTKSDGMFFDCKSLSKINIENLNVSNITSAKCMFADCDNVEEIIMPSDSIMHLKYASYDKCNGSSVEYIEERFLNSSGNSWCYGMFENCYKLKDINLSCFDTSNATSLARTFTNCRSLTALDLSRIDTSKIINMYGIFDNCYILQGLNLTQFNTFNVTDMSYMFRECRNLTTLDLTQLDTSNVIDMSYMFYNCYKLTNLDLASFNTTKVTDMDYMFYGCYRLTSLDLTSFNTAKVTDMSNMFENCSGLTSLDLTPFNTAKVTNMSEMFRDCLGLTNLDLTSLNTTNVTNMSYMFLNCRRLTSLNLTPLDTSKVTDMRSMFYGCSGLTSLDLTPLNTAKVTDMRSMFYGCSSLTSLDLTSLDTANVTDMDYMFFECKNLTSLDLTSLNTQKVTNMENMLNCGNLTSIKTGINFKFVKTNYGLSGTWRNAAGETFNGDYGTANFPSNVADTYTKISS